MEPFETGISNESNYKSFNRKEIMLENETLTPPPDANNSQMLEFAKLAYFPPVS